MPIDQNADPDARNDDQWQDVAGREGPDTTADAAGAADCARLAATPPTTATISGDPVTDLLSGRVPSVLGSDHPLAQTRLFATIGSYPDPSTPHDLDTLVDRWHTDGFGGGAMGEYQKGHELAMVTAVRFRDEAAARDAVQVHLQDLCHHALRSTRLADGSGLTVVRDSGAARTVRAAGRYELSMFVCVCFGADADDRISVLDGWRAYLDGQWGVGGTAPEATSDPHA